jgi:hypothetical protein
MWAAIFKLRIHLFHRNVITIKMWDMDNVEI